MKKFLSYVLIIIYTTFSAGTILHLHYCMGEFVNISLFSSADEDCSKCGMDNHSQSNKCCKDVKVPVKITDKHAPSSFSCTHLFDNKFEQVYPDALDYTFLSVAFISTDLITAANLSPDYERELYIRNRNIRI